MPRGSVVADQTTAPRWLAAFEVAWIFLIFFLLAGSLPPDVGESHYLVKAKHYWQPEWCAGDLFLESQDAHGTFYWTFGWLTRICSLTATAWIGRVCAWLLLAWSWRRLSWAIAPRPLVALLSAALLVFFLRNFHLAGEWVVGGVEAKEFAYALVFLALEAIARAQWRAALLLAGAAGAFHVLVGGWTAVAIGMAWMVGVGDRPRLISLVPAMAGGLLLALPGIVPALVLNWGADQEVVREAARIYVFERLAHHLVYHLFPPAFVARFQVLVVAWAALAWLLRKELALVRVERVVAGAVAIAAVGVVMDQVFVLRVNSAQATALAAELAVAPLLRYYWFRMSDSLVPAGVSLAIVVGILKLDSSRPIVAAWFKVATIVATAANLADVVYWRSQQPLPPAVLQPRPTADSWPERWLGQEHRLEPGEVSARVWYRDWRKVCQWIADKTPPDALFITPREQQTFKWYAGRAEVANWKDVPQDARGLVEWKQRLDEVYPGDREHHRHDLAAFSDEELVSLARKYGATYIVVDRTRSGRRIVLPRLYPVVPEQNQSFAVYHVPEPAKP